MLATDKGRAHDFRRHYVGKVDYFSKIFRNSIFWIHKNPLPVYGFIILLVLKTPSISLAHYHLHELGQRAGNRFRTHHIAKAFIVLQTVGYAESRRAHIACEFFEFVFIQTTEETEQNP